MSINEKVLKDYAKTMTGESLFAACSKIITRNLNDADVGLKRNKFFSCINKGREAIELLNPKLNEAIIRNAEINDDIANEAAKFINK